MRVSSGSKRSGGARSRRRQLANDRFAARSTSKLDGRRNLWILDELGGQLRQKRIQQWLWGAQLPHEHRCLDCVVLLLCESDVDLMRASHV